MEVPITKLSIQQLGAYALRYFPEEFSNIPPADTIRYETHDTDDFYKSCQPLRIVIGRYRNEDLHAYISETRGILHDTSNYSLFPGSSSRDLYKKRKGISFVEPFGRIVRHVITEEWALVRDELGLDVILQYYFGLKDQIKTIKSEYLLTMLEDTCFMLGDVHESKNAHLIRRMFIGSREDRALKRLEFLHQWGPERSQQDCLSTTQLVMEDQEAGTEEACQSYTELNVDATPKSLSQSQTCVPTSKATGIAIQETGAKRKGVTSSNDLDVFKERRNIHLDLLQKSAQSRQAKVKQSAHHISLLADKQRSSETLIAELQNKIIGLTSENEDLRAREIAVADMQKQHAREMTVLKEDHSSQLVNFRSGYEESIDKLAHQLEEERKKTKSLTVDVDHHQRAAEKVSATFDLYKTQSEHRASKAKDLYGIHKAVIALFYEGEDSGEQKDAAIKACEDEFGELDVNLESIED